MKWKTIFLLTIIGGLFTLIQSNFLVDLNEQFSASYVRAREHVISITEPIIICYGDDATFIHRGERFVERIIPKLYHDLKSISHIPFNIYLIVMFNLGTLSEDRFVELKHYLHEIHSIRNRIQFPIEMQQNQYAIIDLSIAFLRSILKTKFVDAVQLKTFCEQARILFTINIEWAARAQLDMLDSKVRPWYTDRFNATERHRVKVIILGPKTARYGYSEKAYFYALLGDRREGKHILYVESVDDEHKALELLGTWLLDARAAASFFNGDEERLHRDLLADAASAHVKRLFKNVDESI